MSQQAALEQRALEQLRRGDLRGAHATLSNLFRLRPKDAGLKHRIDQVGQLIKQREQAQARIQAEPLRYAHAYIKAGRLAEGLQLLRAALTKDPDNQRLRGLALEVARRLRSQVQGRTEAPAKPQSEAERKRAEAARVQRAKLREAAEAQAREDRKAEAEAAQRREAKRQEAPRPKPAPKPPVRPKVPEPSVRSEAPEPSVRSEAPAPEADRGSSETLRTPPPRTRSRHSGLELPPPPQRPVPGSSPLKQQIAIAGTASKIELLNSLLSRIERRRRSI